MLHLVVGLGNPGPEYADTRHNIGFMVVKELLRRHGISDKKAGKQGVTYSGRIGPDPVLLLMPRTYMNLSGDAVLPLMQTRQIPPERTLVVYDDFALPLGRLRIRARGSAGGQNGLKHIIARLGTEEIPRLRLGIGPPGEAVDHVLSPFTPEERQELPAILSRAADCVEAWLARGVEAAANEFNRDPKPPEVAEAAPATPKQAPGATAPATTPMEEPACDDSSPS